MLLQAQRSPHRLCLNTPRSARPSFSDIFYHLHYAHLFSFVGPRQPSRADQERNRGGLKPEIVHESRSSTQPEPSGWLILISSEPRWQAFSARLSGESSRIGGAGSSD